MLYGGMCRANYTEGNHSSSLVCRGFLMFSPRKWSDFMRIFWKLCYNRLKKSSDFSYQFVLFLLQHLHICLSVCPCRISKESQSSITPSVSTFINRTEPIIAPCSPSPYMTAPRPAVLALVQITGCFIVV